MVEQSHTPNAVRKRAQRAQRARDRYIGTGTTVFPSDKSDYSRAERPCSCCRRVFQPTDSAADDVRGVLPARRSRPVS